LINEIDGQIFFVQGKKRVRDEKGLKLVAKLMSLLLQIRVNLITSELYLIC